ncbi:MAG TPA: 3-phosphoshikimate 1-carboxyvinyltransferase, partial [Prolixibacteraceae bacterium]|nr:3-phosphoshikimate 1-carboxyvinyltransferase [Prolixibacteraceae bacterium]
VAKGVPFHFTGLETLKIKETNRIAALQNELRKFGASLVEPRNGELQWDGTINPDLCMVDPVVETYHDHRMALSFAPLALKYGEIRIADPAVISKSYPNFWDDIKHAGFGIDEV